jgi:hypothetical protein
MQQRDENIIDAYKQISDEKEMIKFLKLPDFLISLEAYNSI